MIWNQIISRIENVYQNMVQGMIQKKTFFYNAYPIFLICLILFGIGLENIFWNYWLKAFA